MDVFDHKEIKLQAKRILSNRGAQIRKITWIYCAVAAAVPFLLDLITLLLLDGTWDSMRLRTMDQSEKFQTATSLFSLVSSLVLTMWSAGFIHISISLFRDQPVSTQSLTVGFRLFWPVLRVTLLTELIIAGLSMAAVFISILFSLSLLLSISVFIGCMSYIIYMSYRLRFALYVVLEAPQMGTIQALSYSRRFTEGNCWKLFRLDLSFWWFFALSVLVALVGVLPAILTLAGVITGPFPIVWVTLCSVLLALGSFLLNLKFLPYLSVSLAGAFLFLRDDYLSQERLWY